MAREIIEQGENYKIYNDGTMLFQNVRFSYVHADKPWAKNPKSEANPKGETPKYSVTGMLPKKTHKAAIVRGRKFADEIIDAQKGENSKIFKKDLKFIRDGNDSGKAQYQDHWIVACSEERRPSIRGKDTKPIPLDEIKEKVCSGYWGDLLVRPWWQDNDWGKRVNAGFVALQVKRGKPEDRFGDGGVSEDDIDDTFDAVDDDEDDFDGDDFDVDDDDL